MIPQDRIQAELKNTLNETNFPGLGERHQGKVRESYLQKDRRVIITTDRVSAFDCIIGTIPFKGQVLNQLAAFWFDITKDLVPNHVISVPDPNVMVVHECEQLPLEFIVRGYITGVTKTSAWYNYERGVRYFCGNTLPEGMKKDQKLARPILTPTTKHEKHDRPISREEAIQEGLIDAATFDAAAEICFKLFDAGVKHAAAQGLILVDTKYEIGRLNGKLVVSDEIHTPDSSRYWFADTYGELFKAGQEQRKIDKEYVREWLVSQGFRGDGVPPALTEEVRLEAARRYIQAYEQVTGLEFKIIDEPVAIRITENLRKAGCLK
jgi:phosphoribosylaminoimidazole-succinocarboxamide synthase